MAWARGLKKSNSMTNIKQDVIPKGRQRASSAGARTFFGKPIDFQELKRQMMTTRLAALSSWHRVRSSARGARSLQRSLSKASLTSVGSSDVFLAPNTPLNGSPPPPSEGAAGGRSGGLAARRESQLKDRSVSMWKGVSEILAIDLKRELTTKVKQRMAVTSSCLDRVTGLGDNNEQRPSFTRRLLEFPCYVDQDYGLRPKIPQKIRISPHLSDVIKSDIRVRMGRPRYHEIREQDLAVWNRGQTLDRSHRNLKVFSWLHSLKEDEFHLTPSCPLQQQHSVSDDLALHGDGSDMLLIRAVDDPDVRPLFEHAKKNKKGKTGFLP